MCIRDRRQMCIRDSPDASGPARCGQHRGGGGLTDLRLAGRRPAPGPGRGCGGRGWRGDRGRLR
eukprot:7348203-Prymnesium_polylepis.1